MRNTGKNFRSMVKPYKSKIRSNVVHPFHSYTCIGLKSKIHTHIDHVLHLIGVNLLHNCRRLCLGNKEAARACRNVTVDIS